MTLQQRLRDWFYGNGGKVTVIRAIDRVAEELRELRKAACAGDESVDCLEEAADVYLCLLLVADLLGGSLEEAAERKVRKNLARTWRVDKTGALYHVRKDPAPDAQGGAK